MPVYDVIIQNVEENEDLISVTGLVNKVQVAATVKVKLTPASGSGRVKALDEALVDAFVSRPPREPSAAAHRVSRPE